MAVKINRDRHELDLDSVKESGFFVEDEANTGKEFLTKEQIDFYTKYSFKMQDASGW